LSNALEVSPDDDTIEELLRCDLAPFNILLPVLGIEVFIHLHIYMIYDTSTFMIVVIDHSLLMGDFSLNSTIIKNQCKQWIASLHA
jgi:hypothetical protein